MEEDKLDDKVDEASGDSVGQVLVNGKFFADYIFSNPLRGIVFLLFLIITVLGTTTIFFYRAQLKNSQENTVQLKADLIEVKMAYATCLTEKMEEINKRIAYFENKKKKDDQE